MSDKYRRDLSEKQNRNAKVQSSIAEKGYYITKSTNRKMTKLGVRALWIKQEQNNRSSRTSDAQFYQSSDSS